VTFYALLDDGTNATLLATWPSGRGHQATTVCPIAADLGELAAQLCEALTQLSQAMWHIYTDPESTGDPNQQMRQQERGDGMSHVADALTNPNLPDDEGALLISYDPVMEWAHTSGRVLYTIADPAVTAAVTTDVIHEITAVQRAGLGDITGRAIQAVALNHIDPSPVQVAAADRLLHEQPLGTPQLWTAIDPAASCVAAAHWLTAAAEVAAEEADLDATSVFSYADDIEAVSVEVPTMIVGAICEQDTPRDIVTELLADANIVATGRHPDPVGLPALVDAARDQVQRLKPRDRDIALAGLLESLTPLDPRRPSRDLLEHLLDGIRACLVVYSNEIDEHGPPAEPSGFVLKQFRDAVRQRAALTHHRVHA
jgi:hypothetical protein